MSSRFVSLSFSLALSLSLCRGCVTSQRRQVTICFTQRNVPLDITIVKTYQSPVISSLLNSPIVSEKTLS
jgi:hypothetical protein